MSVWIRLLPNILTLLVNWISWQNIILEMLKYVTLNLFPLAHAASGQNTFLFFSIATVDSNHETGRSSRGLVTWSLFCATCSELLLHRLQGAKAMPLVAEGTLLCLLPFPLLPLFMQVAAFAGSGLARSSFRTPFCGNECWSPELCSACTPWVTTVAGFCLPHCTTFAGSIFVQLLNVLCFQETFFPVDLVPWNPFLSQSQIYLLCFLLLFFFLDASTAILDSFKSKVVTVVHRVLLSLP